MPNWLDQLSDNIKDINGGFTNLVKKTEQYHNPDGTVMNSLDKTGYNGSKFYPYNSPEGGAKTIGYGHKLKSGEDYSKGLTSGQADVLLFNDTQEHTNLTKSVVDKKYGVGTFDKLPQTSKSMLTEYNFSVAGGINKFPNMVDGILKNDWNKVSKEYEISSGGKPLTEKNKAIYDYFIKPRLKLGGLLKYPNGGTPHKPIIVAPKTPYQLFQDSTAAYNQGLLNQEKANNDFNSSPLKPNAPVTTNNTAKGGSWYSLDYGWDTDLPANVKSYETTTGFSHLHHHNPADDTEIVTKTDGSTGVLDPMDYKYNGLLPNDILHLQNRIIPPGKESLIQSTDKFYPMYKKPVIQVKNPEGEFIPGYASSSPYGYMDFGDHKRAATYQEYIKHGSQKPSHIVNTKTGEMSDGSFKPQFALGGVVGDPTKPWSPTNLDGYNIQNPVTSNDSLAHQAGKTMDYEFTKGSPTGTGLPDYGYHQSQLPQNQVPANWTPPTNKQDAVSLYMKELAPRLTSWSSAMEKGEAGDFLYNTGRDPRVYQLDQYLKSIGQSGLPDRGSYNVDTKTPQWTPELQGSLDTEWNKYSKDINKLPENQRRILMNKGRDFYYQNINKNPDGSPNDAYKNTWYGRIWNTNKFKNGGKITNNWLDKL